MAMMSAIDSIQNVANLRKRIRRDGFFTVIEFSTLIDKSVRVYHRNVSNATV